MCVRVCMRVWASEGERENKNNMENKINMFLYMDSILRMNL